MDLDIRRSISIYGKKVKIVFVDMIDDKSELGEFNSQTYVIKIKRGLSKELTVNTYLHELFHAVLHRIGVADNALSAELEEVIVDSLSKFLAETDL